MLCWLFCRSLYSLSVCCFTFYVSGFRFCFLYYGLVFSFVVGLFCSCSRWFRLVAALSLIFGYGLWAGMATLIVTLIYLFAGNVAPLSEIIVGVILESRFRLCFYVPVLLISFILNVFICTKSLFDLLVSKFCGKTLKWVKTVHRGE